MLCTWAVLVSAFFVCPAWLHELQRGSENPGRAMVSTVVPLLLCNWDGDFGSPTWNLHFLAQLSNTKALEEPAAIPKPDVISTFIDCFTSAKTRE